MHIIILLFIFVLVLNADADGDEKLEGLNVSPYYVF